MPEMPKRFGAAAADKPTAKPAAKPRESSHKRGYDRAWSKFRAWFATIVVPVCGAKLGGMELEYCCGESFEASEMHLDHLIPFKGIDDPLRLDENNVAWRCRVCHSRKTNAKDGGGWRNNG